MWGVVAGISDCKCVETIWAVRAAILCRRHGRRTEGVRPARGDAGCKLPAGGRHPQRRPVSPLPAPPGHCLWWAVTFIPSLDRTNVYSNLPAGRCYKLKDARLVPSPDMHNMHACRAPAVSFAAGLRHRLGCGRWQRRRHMQPGVGRASDSSLHLAAGLLRGGCRRGPCC